MAGGDGRPHHGTTRSYWLQRQKVLNAQFNQLLMETGISSGNELIYVQENQSQTLIYPVIIYSVIIKVSHYRRACSML